MNIHEFFASAGFFFDPAPPLSDNRQKPCIAYRQMPDSTFAGFAAIEAERFLIPEKGENDARQEEKTVDRLKAWAKVVDALVSLSEPREFLQVIARRESVGIDGALTRFGWVAIGRGNDVFEATVNTEKTLRDLFDIQSAFIDYALLRFVDDGEALFDLVRCCAAPFITAVRRTPWRPGLTIETPETVDSIPMEMIAQWKPRAVDWSPLIKTVAESSSPTAFIVKVFSGIKVPQHTIAEAENNTIRINKVISETRRKAISSQVEPSADHYHESTVNEQILLNQYLLNDTMARRLETLHGPCLYADACLATWVPADNGLVGIICSSLNAEGFTDSGAGAIDKPRQQIRVRPVAVLAGNLWRDLDEVILSELIVGPFEATALIRTPEPPRDENFSMSCSRARPLLMHPAQTHGTIVGRVTMHGNDCEVRLCEETRLRHVYVVGQTGTGKSTLLLNMITQDIEAGHGITVLDPHGTLINDILSRLPASRKNDVILVDPSRNDRFIPFNPLMINIDDPLKYQLIRDRIIEEFLDVIDNLYDLLATGGPMFEMNFRCFMVLLMGPQRPKDYTPLLTMFEDILGRDTIAKTLATRHGSNDPMAPTTLSIILKTGGEGSLRNVAPYITSKINRFIGNSITRHMLCQNECLDFAKILSERKIFLAHLSPARIGRDAAALLARQMILRLNIAAIERGAVADSPIHFIYADEFHAFATERFAAMLSEARKFRLGLVLAHQYTSQLVKGRSSALLDAVLGNVGTAISYRVGIKDAELLQDVMAPRVHATDLSGLPNFSAFIRSSGTLGNTPFLMRMPPPAAPRNTSTKEIREASQCRYGHTIEEIDRQIEEETKKFRAIA
jgi:hypothetical protein